MVPFVEELAKALGARLASPQSRQQAFMAGVTAGCAFADLVSATRFLTDVAEQDDLNRVWAAYLGGHLPTTTTVEVSRLATHPRCKIEISAIAIADAAAPRRRKRWQRAGGGRGPSRGPRR